MIKDNWYKVVAVILLLWALGSHPYGYYQLLRWVVAIVAAYSAYQAYEHKKNFWTWTFVAMAILFNPIMPFYLERETWQILDVAAAVVFGVSLYKKA